MEVIQSGQQNALVVIWTQLWCNIFALASWCATVTSVFWYDNWLITVDSLIHL